MRKKIKILFVIDQLSLGGAERHLIQVLQRMDRRTFEPHVWVLHGKWDLLPEVEASGIPFERLNIPNIFSWQALRAVPRWIVRIRREKFQIVHTYLFAANIYGQFLAWLAGVPVRISGRREMVTWMGREHIAVTRLVNRTVHHWIAVSHAVARNVSQIEHLPRRKIAVVPNGVDLRRFTPENRVNGFFREAAIPEGAPLILNVGSYRPVKGQLTFVHACQRVVAQRPDVHCAIVGEPREPVLSRLKAALKQGGADHIHLLPPTNQMPQIYPRASLLVVSSLFEGFSNTILEAGASGVPVVATAVGGNPEAVVEDLNGRLVPAENPDQMAAVLLFLLNHPSKLKALKKTARRYVEQHFSLEKMVRRMEKWYKAWLKEKTQ